MVTEQTTKARRWLSLRFFWGVLFILGGLACIGHAIVVPASKHDVTHGIGPQGPETTDSAPWAWALGGGILIAMGIARTGWVWYQQRDETSA